MKERQREKKEGNIENKKKSKKKGMQGNAN